jgi:protein-tyrosine phosphatase
VIVFERKIGVLFICMGNICRSPTAEGVFRRKVSEAQLDDRFDIDSAGTHAYHVGDPPDERSQRAAAVRGYDLSALLARQIGAADYTRFDYLLAMDEGNLALLRERCPAGHAHKLSLFMTWGLRGERIAVPDPYYGGARGFERVLDMVEDAAQGLLRGIRAKHGF